MNPRNKHYLANSLLLFILFSWIILLLGAKPIAKPTPKPVTKSISKPTAKATPKPTPTPRNKIQKFFPSKPPPPSERFYKLSLSIGDSRANYQIPSDIPAYSILTIDYTVSGRDPMVGLEANAFENVSESILKSCSNSSLPYHLKIGFKYLGCMPLKELGNIGNMTTLRLRRYLSAQKYHQQVFEVINEGNCILKSQGFGMVSYQIRVADEKGNILDWGNKYLQPTEKDLYPGETTRLTCLMDPLPPGKYQLQLLAHLHNESAFYYADAGPLVAQMNIPITVMAEENPFPSFVIPEQLDIAPPPIFPNSFYHWEEFLQSFQVHALGNKPISGKLFLPMGNDSCYIIVKLLSQQGVANSAWNINVKPNPALGKIDKRKQSKAIAGNLLDNRILSTYLDPNSICRFTLNPDSTIHQDLAEMNKLGIKLLYLPLTPNSLSEYKIPMKTIQQDCRKYGIRIIPILHSWSERKSDTDELPIPRIQWYEKLDSSWKDLFYRGTKGRIPLLFDMSQPEDIWLNSFVNYVSEDSSGFQHWLWQRYRTKYDLERSWDTTYQNLYTIDSTLISPHYSESFRDNPVLRDWYSYKSFQKTNLLLSTIQGVREKQSKVMPGIMPLAIYGLEYYPGVTPYSFSDYNWVGAKTGYLPEYLFSTPPYWLDLIVYRNINPEMNIPKLVDYAHQQKVTPVLLAGFNDAKFIPQIESHPFWEKEGGWWGVPNLKGRDYCARNALYPLLRNIYESGGIPGIYAWKDYSHLIRMNHLQKQEIQRFQNDFLK